MLSLAQSGYTADQVKAALHAHERTERFEYELLSSNNQVKQRLSNVLGGNLKYNALADIKGIARFSILDDGTINFASDRIKVYTLIQMPDGGWAKFAKGVYLLSSPNRSGSIRDIEAYDTLKQLDDDSFDDRFTIRKDENVIQKASEILSGAGIPVQWQNLTQSDKKAPEDRDFDTAKSKRVIVNELLSWINYYSLSIDGNGFAVSLPYVSPDVRASEYLYRDDSKSVIFPDPRQRLDYFDVPNYWVVTVSEPDRPPMRSIEQNTDPTNLTSIISRGRVIKRQITVDAVDKPTLDEKARRCKFEDSQIFEQVEFESLIMPQHTDADVFTLEYTGLGISAKFSEVSWEYDLQPGAVMKHVIRRVVSV